MIPVESTIGLTDSVWTKCTLSCTAVTDTVSKGVDPTDAPCHPSELG